MKLGHHSFVLPAGTRIETNMNRREFSFAVITAAGAITLARYDQVLAGRGSAWSNTQEDNWTALKTDSGILFVWNRRSLHFTLSIKGDDIRPLNDPNNIFFLVDGIVLQIQSLPINDFAADARKNKLDDKSILLAHRDWESRFLESELLKTKIVLKCSSDKLANGTEALIWQYDLPEKFKSPDAHAQIYLTMVAQDYVVLLNSVINPTAPEAKVRAFLKETLSTIKTSAETIDVKKLQEAIRKGSIP